MKLYSLFLLLTCMPAFASAADFSLKDFRERLNKDWEKRNYAQMEKTIDSTIKQHGRKPVILADIFQFYVWAIPDYSKTQAIAKELDKLIRDRGTDVQVELGSELLKLTLAIPEKEFAPHTKEIKDGLHGSFPEYPFNDILTGLIAELTKESF